MKYPLTRHDMNRLYPAQMKGLGALDLPNGAHHFALDIQTNELTFESFGEDNRLYKWRGEVDPKKYCTGSWHAVPEAGPV